MQHQQQNTGEWDVQAACALVLNIISSVFIIFLNKTLMRTFMFTFATTLSAFHFVCSALTVQLTQCCQTNDSNKQEAQKGRWINIVVFVSIQCLSLMSLNLSLLINTVGFYQIAKLLVTPFVCVIEAVFLGRRFSMQVVTAIATVVIGVGVVSLTDFQVKPLGLVVAMISVVASGSGQLLIRDLQTRLNMQPNELLLKSAWPQGLIMLSVGPVLDKAISDRWVNEFKYTNAVLGLISMTCCVAIIVNMSQFFTLKGFSAAAYSVTGHLKTIIVLLGGVLFFNEIVTVNKGIGMIMAVLGMIAYGYCTIKEKQSADEQKQNINLEPPNGKQTLSSKRDVEHGEYNYNTDDKSNVNGGFTLPPIRQTSQEQVVSINSISQQQ
eukprot:TRINITY_DN638_c0_g1_i1.p1 TRINITY_DN638_c0_g1~~TRINITY_DN638_c0_g1_i1.p1  ORF type:complete len:380 (-),score=17.54 TRINITY_DN638_c0_g1_i1:778-1917(-)